MKTFYDVQQLIKTYGTIVYTKDRLTDVHLMEAEINELYGYGMIDGKTYQHALLVIRREGATVRQA
ncbi:YqgQ family protein [Shouchella shacheensis]|uniref:YqgQ family protein n=1 Tax=Shouchella shacheensis TaxID=1649580 RepID=UPI00074039A7|nr:YqgQ family protein [Shouchella shacheensis]